MYRIKRYNDDLTLEFTYAKSVTILEGKNDYQDFIPRIGDSYYTYSRPHDGQQTTEIKSITKISGNEYEFTTLNSNYNIKRL